MPLTFENLDSDVGLKKLNGFLTTRSYLDGYSLSQLDVDTFATITGECPSAEKYPHVARWYRHVAATMESSGLKPSATASKPCPAAPKAAPKAAAPAKAEDDDDDDLDDDMFGSDDDDEDEEAQKKAAEKAAAAKAAAAKKKVVGRSQCLFDIKPWEADTDLEELAQKIKSTDMPGVTWGVEHKLVPVAFGIKKLVLSCVIVDDEVPLDDLTDFLESFEDYVQSVDMVAMNKV